MKRALSAPQGEWPGVSLLLLLLAACGPEHPPVLDPGSGGRAQNGGSGQGASENTGATGADDSGADAGTSTGAGSNGGSSGSEPPGPGACEALDAEHAHFYGTFEHLADDSTHSLLAIAPGLDAEHPCLNIATPYLPTVEPGTTSMVFIDGLFQRQLLRAVTNELEYSAPPRKWDLGAGTVDDEVIETPGCTSPTVAVFHVNPADGSIIYNCAPYLDSVDLECDRFSMQLKPFEWTCLDGPYYAAGDVVSEGTLPIHGFTLDGRWVVSTQASALGLGYLDPETMAETPFAGERPVVGASVMAGRAREDGVWLVYEEYQEGVHHFYRVSVDGAGQATTDGEYGQLEPGQFWDLITYGAVLDSAGDLYLSVNLRESVIVSDEQGIAYLPFGGTSSLVYETTGHPDLDPSNADIADAFVLLDYQSPVFSGPTLRF